ncbi:VCBS repeat-containing protein, partial [Candidatus Sumerlaeota bacterium]|nr:VCBS repeat-containing protein [Candidatus Sumerlaeota bacterium]
TYNGWLPLTGDVDGTGSDDLIQVTEYGDAWVSISTETSYAAPSRWGWLGYRFNRGASGESGAIPLAGDANGDGLCDLIQVTEYRDVWVALSTQTMYNSPSRWGWLGFKYAPFDGWYPLCGDVNADGADDLIQITPTGDLWVSLSTGSAYASPSRWGWLDFYYDEAQGYYPIMGDVNADGKADLIQITPSGEALVAFSTGSSFDSPEHWGWLGFLFDRNQGYMPFYLEY